MAESRERKFNYLRFTTCRIPNPSTPSPHFLKAAICRCHVHRGDRLFVFVEIGITKSDAFFEKIIARLNAVARFLSHFLLDPGGKLDRIDLRGSITHETIIIDQHALAALCGQKLGLLIDHDGHRAIDLTGNPSQGFKRSRIIVP